MDRVSMMMRHFSGWCKIVLLLGLFWALMPDAFALRAWFQQGNLATGYGSDCVNVTFKLSGSIPADRIQAQGGNPVISINFVSDWSAQIPLILNGNVYTFNWQVDGSYDYYVRQAPHFSMDIQSVTLINGGPHPVVVKPIYPDIENNWITYMYPSWSPCPYTPYELNEVANWQLFLDGKPVNPAPTVDQSTPQKDALRAVTQAEPVNVISGAMNADELDFEVPGRPFALAMTRHYNNLVAGAGALGAGWSHGFSAAVQTTNVVTLSGTNAWCVVRWADGRSFWFHPPAAGGSALCTENAMRLEAATNQWRLHLGGGVSYAFDTNGVLQQKQNSSGEQLALTYTNDFPQQQLSGVTDSNGRQLLLTYDGSNRLAHVAAANTALSVDYAYDASNRLAQASIHANGGVLTRSYAYDDATGCLTQKVDEAGIVTTWAYEAGSNSTVRCTHSRVGTGYFDTAFAYDRAESNLHSTVMTESVSGGQRISWFSFDDAKLQLMAVKGPAANDETVVGSAGTRYAYDGAGNITNETHYVVADDTSHPWLAVARTYDGARNLLSQATGYNTAPANVWSYTWNTNENLLTSSVDPEGHRTMIEYTGTLPSRVRVFNGGSSSDTAFEYNGTGWLTGLVNGNGHRIGYGYDAQGHLTTVTPQAGPAYSYAYDSLGRVAQATLGNASTSFTRDDFGRVTQITYPNQQSETLAYDASGNVTNHTDIAGRATRFTWLPAHTLASVTRTLEGATPQAATIAYNYNEQMEALQIRDELNRPVEGYALDLQGRPLTVTNLDGQVMTVTYGLGSMVQSVQRFDGSVLNSTYDGEGRLATQTGPDFTNQMTYLRNGLLNSIANGAGSIGNTYDGANRLTAVTQPVPQGSVTYDYLLAGQVYSVTSVAGTTTYRYDAAERLTQLTAPAGQFRYAYDPNNGLVASVQGGVQASYGYDLLGRVTSIAWRSAAGKALRSFGYAYDASGLITQKVTTANGQVTTEQYGYDSLGRLTSEISLGATTSAVTYAYDLAGNRTTKQVNGSSGTLATVNYALGQGNRLAGWTVAEDHPRARLDVAGTSSKSIGTDNRFGQLWVGASSTNQPAVAGTNFWAQGVEVGAGTQQVVAAIRDAAGNVGRMTNSVVVRVATAASYSYSIAGCVTNISYGDGTGALGMGLTWNGQYQLTATTTNGVAAEQYGYDALGRRIWTASGGVTTYSVYDGAQVIADVDASGALLRSYTWGPGIDNLLALTVHTGATVRTYYAIKDHLGSVHALVDATGITIEQYRFDAWGRTTVYDGVGNPLTQSALGNRYVWQGSEISWATGLYYFRARWYDSVSGRWLSNDPIGISGGLNQYVFCGDNSVNCRDSFGLCTESGDEYVGKYIAALSQNKWIILCPPYMAIWSLLDQRDIKWSNRPWGWLNEYTLRGDQMGNAGAAFALSEVYDPVTALLVTRTAGVFFRSGGFLKGNVGAFQDVNGSYEMNDLGINEWMKTPKGQEWVAGVSFAIGYANQFLFVVPLAIPKGFLP